MLADLIEILLLVVRGALFAGVCWGAWLCLGERLSARQPGNTPPLERFATFAVFVLLLSALGGVSMAP